MPGLQGILDTDPSLCNPASAVAEKMAIYLPSSLNPSNQTSACIAGLVEVEDRLRLAHCTEALEDLRRHLRTRSFATKLRRHAAHSQGTYTRARALQDQIDGKVRAATVRYRAARKALLSLRGPGHWEEGLRELQDGDIRGLNERALTEREEEEQHRAHRLAGIEDSGLTINTVAVTGVETGEGRRSLSWLWYNVSADEASEEIGGTMHDCIRVEWVKARARADRWHEELQLLEEEMRRVLAYCVHRAKWWEEQPPCRQLPESTLLEGLRAYAAEHAHSERRLAAKWSAQWAAVRERAKLAFDNEGGVDTEGLGTIEVELDLDVDKEGDYDF